MPLAFVFLFLLMIWAGLTVEWSVLKSIFRQPLKLFTGLGFLFLVFPLVQYGIARVLIHDVQFLYGLVFASLTPIAIVAPYFTRLVKGDEGLSFLLLVASMLLCPFIAPPLLKLLLGHRIAIQTWPLFKYMLLLITLPLVISYGIARFLPALKRRITPHLGLLNMTTLSILIYILWGNAAGRINLSYTAASDIAAIIGLVLFQDFGVLFISRRLFMKKYMPPPAARAFTISLSMKNVAIAAGLLLFYDPRAALPPAAAFIAHALLFNFIPLFKQLFIGTEIGVDAQ
jgi:BASS family bile acid:Na+ symporter